MLVYRLGMTRLGGYVVRACCVAGILAAVLLAPAAHAAPLEPNDPYWRQSWSQAVLRMPEVWQRTTGSPDVIIGMVDTGVDPSIPDLQGALVPGWDFVANDAVPRDTNGHGTHVASVMAARGNNGIGIAGYCWGCRLMPVRITPDGRATPQQIAQGIYWAVDHGSRIITIGFNSGSQSFDESSAMRYAREKGVLVIASAGNAGTEALRYPAAYPGVLPVAATNDSDVLYFWSSRGSWVPLSAPGCQLVLDASVGQGTLCGTSFTPAAVAGVAGLMLSLKPSLTADEIVQALVSTAVPVQGIGGGRIDPVAALNAVAPQAPVSPSGGGGAVPIGTTVAVAPALGVALTRTLEFRRGVMHHRISHVVRVPAGRLDVQLHTSRAEECQISIVTPTRDFVLSLLPPGEPTLLTMSQNVKAGRHRVEIECDSTRRRSYALEISSIAVRTTSARGR
jgi:subtilisin family serine protease